MKTPAVITLILMGTVLITAPIGADYLQRAQIVDAMAKSGAMQVTLGESLSDTYRLGCWFIGAVMIGAAVFSPRCRRE